jgi:hypothetical protein
LKGDKFAVGKIKKIKGKDGSIYEGAVKRVGLLKSVKHGRGTIILPDGFRYEGEWQDDFYHGIGCLTGLDGSYTGDFSRGLRHGKGILTLGNGYRYEGEYRNGRQNGQGTLILPDGTTLKGKFYKSLCIGLPRSEVISVYGEPGDTKQKVTKNGKVEKMFYGKKVGKRGGISYTMEITITNGKVSGWKDL